MNPATFEEAEALEAEARAIEEAEERFRRSMEAMEESASDKCQWERAWQSATAGGPALDRPPAVWEAFLQSVAAPRPTAAERPARAPRSSGAKRPRDEAAADGAPANARRRKECSSRFFGVTWWARDGTWAVRYTDARGNQVHVGSFDDEEAAARAYNDAVKKAGLRRRLNQEVNGQLLAKPEMSSSFLGVAWHKGVKKWAAKVTRSNKCGLDGTMKTIGRFDDEIEAAKAVDKYIREHMPTIAAGEHRRRTLFFSETRGRPTARR